MKEEAIHEYRDSDTLLVELEGSYVDGFDNCLRQVKATFLDLDLSHVTIDTKAQTLIQPVHSESMDELFNDDALIDDPRGDGECTLVESQIKLVEDSTHQPDEVLVVVEKNENTLVQ